MPHDKPKKKKKKNKAAPPAAKVSRGAASDALCPPTAHDPVLSAAGAAAESTGWRLYVDEASAEGARGVGQAEPLFEANARTDGGSEGRQQPVGVGCSPDSPRMVWVPPP